MRSGQDLGLLIDLCGAVQQTSAHHILDMGGKRLAVGEGVNAHRLVIEQFHTAIAPGRQHLDQMGRESHLAPPTVETRILALWCMIDQRDGLDAGAVFQIVRKEGLKQR